MQQDITVIRGTTNEFDIKIVDDSGNSYELTDGETLRFGVKRNSSCNTYEIVKNLTSADQDSESGTYRVKITPEDTADLNCGTYCYDAGVQSGDDYFNIIECSHFTVAHNITTKEA